MNEKLNDAETFINNKLIKDEDNTFNLFVATEHISFQTPKRYKLKTERIKSLEDVKMILKALDITFDEYSELNNLPDEYKEEV